MSSLSARLSKYGSIVLIVALAVAVVVLTFTNLSRTENETENEEQGLSVDGIYFLSNPATENENQVPLEATLYLSNRSKSTGSVRIVSYVVDPETNIAENKNTLEVGTIPGDTTWEIEASISVPTLEDSYNVDLLIFEDNLLMLKGSGSIGVEKVWFGENEARYELSVTNLGGASFEPVH